MTDALSSNLVARLQERAAWLRKEYLNGGSVGRARARHGADVREALQRG